MKTVSVRPSSAVVIIVVHDNQSKTFISCPYYYLSDILKLGVYYMLVYSVG